MTSIPDRHPQFENYRDNIVVTWTWDVRNTVPPHLPPLEPIRPPVEPGEDDDRVYQTINMMTYLLDGIPFDVFMDQPYRVWIDDVLYKVREQKRWPGRDTPDNPRPKKHEDFPNNGLRGWIYQRVDEIKQVAGDSLKFREFWESRRADWPAGSPIRRTYDAFLKLKSERPVDAHRFCLTFIDFQDKVEAGAKQLVSQNDMNKFVVDMAGVTHLDIATKSRRYFGTLAAAVDWGKELGIIASAGDCGCSGGSGDMEAMGGGGGTNDRKCSADLNTCVTYPGSYCTTDSNGYCTVG